MIRKILVAAVAVSALAASTTAPAGTISSTTRGGVSAATSSATEPATRTLKSAGRRGAGGGMGALGSVLRWRKVMRPLVRS